MSLGFGVVQLDVSVVNVAIRPIGDALGGGVAALQWIVSAYTIMFASFILSAGAFGDRAGARRVFVGGFALFTAASALCGVAPTLGRADRRTGAAGTRGRGAGPVLADPPQPRLPGAARARPSGGDVGSRRVDWPVGRPGGRRRADRGARMASDLLHQRPDRTGRDLADAPLRGRDPRARDRSVDLPGQLAAVVTLASLAAATIEGGTVGWTRPGILAGYAISAVSLVVFLRIESRRRSPLLPLALFRRPDIQRFVGDGTGAEHRVLRLHLRAEPVLPA